MIRTALFALLLFTSASFAQQAEVACNQHGAIVKVDTGEKFYLGNSCDAILEGVGEGKWYLTASAFAVEIDGQGYLLPVEVNCDLPACWYDGLDVSD
jgi:hypothetical protein